MRISDWSSDVCSSDLRLDGDDERDVHGGQDEQWPDDVRENVDGDDARGAGSHRRLGHDELVVADRHRLGARDPAESRDGGDHNDKDDGSEARADRSEEHTSESQSLMRSTYAVLC